MIEDNRNAEFSFKLKPKIIFDHSITRRIDPLLSAVLVAFGFEILLHFNIKYVASSIPIIVLLCRVLNDLFEILTDEISIYSENLENYVSINVCLSGNVYSRVVCYLIYKLGINLKNYSMLPLDQIVGNDYVLIKAMEHYQWKTCTYSASTINDKYTCIVKGLVISCEDRETKYKYATRISKEYVLNHNFDCFTDKDG